MNYGKRFLKVITKSKIQKFMTSEFCLIRLNKIKCMNRIKFLIKHIIFRLVRKSIPEKLSKGEAFIKAWLSYNNVKFEQQYYVGVPRKVRNSGCCYIDFMVSRHGKQYAIEFNGKQHYFYTPKFHKNLDGFSKQQFRDKFIEQWCLENHIEFIEIPYTYSTAQIEMALQERFKL